MNRQVGDRVQFSATFLRSTGQYTTVDTVPVSADSCYFDRHITFQSSGTVRLVYTYPTGTPGSAAGAQVPSRTVDVTVR